MRIEHSVEIARPVEQVFAYTSDPENDPAWAGAKADVRRISEGPTVVGSSHRETVSFLGRRIDHTVEVADLEPDTSITWRDEHGPAPGTVVYAYEPVGEGTRFTLRLDVDLGGLLALAEPLVTRAGDQRVQADLTALKDVLESAHRS
ncbi:MAG: SRPBCC family protein [Actinomycetota bacterium]|nr:SRPBCC family protein [Actinomycetota bacterium]